MKLRISVLAVAACTFALTACGSDSEGSQAVDSQGPTLDEAKTMMVDYFTKSFSADAAACEHESEEYSAQLNEQYATKDCAERIEALKEMLSDDTEYLDASKSVITISEGENGTALAEVEHEWEGFGGTYTLKVQNGAWVVDGEKLPTSTGFPGLDRREVSEDEAAAIWSSFCAVKPGTSRAEVEGILGAPGTEEVDDDGAPELSWAINQDMYTVWLDESSNVANSSSSTPREDSSCPE